MKLAATTISKLVVFILLCTLAVWPAVADAGPKKDKPTVSADNSDLNGDGNVDYDDLVIFSSKYLEQNIDELDWCEVYQAVALGKRVYGKLTTYYQKHFKTLLGIVNDLYGCEGGQLLLTVINEPRYFARITIDAQYTGNYYVSDPIVGSVFIYDPNWSLIGELKNLDTPLGVAIDSQGNLLVGSDGKNRIEIFDPDDGDLIGQFGDGITKLPNAITIGPGGEIFITDSRSNTVWEFDASYDPIPVRHFGTPGRGDGQLKFPLDTAIIAGEVFIADQVNKRIQVYDMHGNFLRTLEPPNVVVVVEPDPDVDYWWGCGFMSPPPGEVCPPEPIIKGSFNRLQALAVDSFGRLHSLDAFEAAVNVLNPESGEYVDSYGAWGDGPDLLRVPMDVLVTDLDQSVVTDGDNNVIEFFDVPLPPTSP